MGKTNLLDFIGIRYLDALVSGGISGYVTKEELDAVEATAKRAYHFRGSVPAYSALPASGNSEGDVWNVGDSLEGDNYVWAPDSWMPLRTGVLPCTYKGEVASAEALPSEGVSAYDAYGISAVSGAAVSQYYAYQPNGEWLLLASGVSADTSYSYAGYASSVGALPSSASFFETYGIAAGASAIPSAFYYYASAGWDRLGAPVDLSGYITSADLATLVSAGVMSPEDKAKLDNIDWSATRVLVDAALSASASANHTVANSALHSLFAAKLDRNVPASYAVNAGGAVVWNQNGAMTAEDKIKLDGIASGANFFVLEPATTVSLGGVIVDQKVDSTFVDACGWTHDSSVGPYDYKGTVAAKSDLPSSGAKKYDLWSIPHSYQDPVNGNWSSYFYVCSADSCAWAPVSSGLTPKSSDWPQVYVSKGDVPVPELLPRFSAQKYDVWGISAPGASGASEYWACTSGIDECQWMPLPPDPEPYHSRARVYDSSELPTSVIAGIPQVNDVYGCYPEGARPRYFVCTAASCVWSALPSGYDPNKWPFSHSAAWSAATVEELPAYGTSADGVFENAVWSVPFSSGTSSGVSNYVCTVAVDQCMYEERPLRAPYDYKGDVPSDAALPASGAKLWSIRGIAGASPSSYYVCTASARSHSAGTTCWMSGPFDVPSNTPGASRVVFMPGDGALPPGSYWMSGGSVVSSGTTGASQVVVSAAEGAIPQSESGYHVVQNAAVYSALQEKIARSDYAFSGYMSGGAEVSSGATGASLVVLDGTIKASDYAKLKSIDSGAKAYGPATTASLGLVYVDDGLFGAASEWVKLASSANPMQAPYSYKGVVVNAAALPASGPEVNDVWGVANVTPIVYYAYTENAQWSPLSSGVDPTAAPYSYKGNVASSACLPSGSAAHNEVWGISGADPSAYYACAVGHGWYPLPSGADPAEPPYAYSGSVANYGLLPSNASVNDVYGIPASEPTDYYVYSSVIPLSDTGCHVVQNAVLHSAIGSMTSAFVPIEGNCSIGGTKTFTSDIVGNIVKGTISSGTGTVAFGGTAAFAEQLVSGRAISITGGAVGSTPAVNLFDGTSDVVISVNVSEYSWNSKSGGTAGLVPPAGPGAASSALYLTGDGTWREGTAIAGDFVHLIGNGQSATVPDSALVSETISGAKVFSQAPYVPDAGSSFNYRGSAYVAASAVILADSGTTASFPTGGDILPGQQILYPIGLSNGCFKGWYRTASGTWAQGASGAVSAGALVMALFQDGASTIAKMSRGLLMSSIHNTSYSSILYSVGGFYAGEVCINDNSAAASSGAPIAGRNMYSYAGGGYWTPTTGSTGDVVTYSGSNWYKASGAAAFAVNATILQEAANVNYVLKNAYSYGSIDDLNSYSGAGGGRHAIVNMPPYQLADLGLGVDEWVKYPLRSANATLEWVGSAHRAFPSGSRCIGIGKHLAASSGAVLETVARTAPARVPTASFYQATVSSCLAASVKLASNDVWAARALWLCAQNGSSHFYGGNTDAGSCFDAKWQAGVRCADGATLTGTGPLDWNDDGNAGGLTDMLGNLWELVDGVRVLDGEIQVSGYPVVTGSASASGYTTYYTSRVDGWGCIMPGSQGGVVSGSLVDTYPAFSAAGTSPTPDSLRFYSGGSGIAVGASSAGTGVLSGDFSAIAADGTVAAAASALLKEICLLPIGGTVVQNGACTIPLSGTAYLCRGCSYKTGSGAGLFGMRFVPENATEEDLEDVGFRITV